MSKKKDQQQTTAALALSAESAPDVLTLLKEELKSLVRITETPYKTSGAIKTANGTLNIKEEGGNIKVDVLIEAFSSILFRAKAIEEAREQLGQPKVDVKVDGYTVADWKHDIQLKATIITHDARKKELEELVKEGQGYMTREDQFKLYLQKVAATVKGETAE